MSATQTRISYETLPFDRQRGVWGMSLFIATEASLFVILFFSYYFLAAQNPDWPLAEPPKLKLALTMTVVLVTSSFVLHWGEGGLEKRQYLRARLGIAGTLLLGAAFMTLQVFEYREHLKTLTPTTNSYGSIFYTITSLHALHLLLGMSMLLFVLCLPRLHPARRPPYRSMHNASMYWHFVDAVWLVIITLLYIVPNLHE